MFNMIKWMALVLKSFIDTKSDFLNTVTGGIGVKDNEKVTIPIFDIAPTGMQEDGADTVFAEPSKSFVEISTTNEIKHGIANTRKDQLSTNADLMGKSALLVGQQIRRQLSYRVREQLFVGAGNKLTFDGADGGTGVTELTHKMFLKASEIFAEAEIPESERFVCVPPSLRSQVINIKDSDGKRIFVPISATGEKALFDGHIGKIDGWNIGILKVPMLSTAGNVVAVPTQKAIAFYHRTSLSWGAEKKIYVDKQFNNVKSRDEIFNQIFWGGKVVHANRVITVRENTP